MTQTWAGITDGVTVDLTIRQFRGLAQRLALLAFGCSCVYTSLSSDFSVGGHIMGFLVGVAAIGGAVFELGRMARTWPPRSVTVDAAGVRYRGPSGFSVGWDELREVVIIPKPDPVDSEPVGHLVLAPADPGFRERHPGARRWRFPVDGSYRIPLGSHVEAVELLDPPLGRFGGARYTGRSPAGPSRAVGAPGELSVDLATPTRAPGLLAAGMLLLFGAVCVVGATGGGLDAGPVAHVVVTVIGGLLLLFGLLVLFGWWVDRRRTRRLVIGPDGLRYEDAAAGFAVGWADLGQIWLGRAGGTWRRQLRAASQRRAGLPRPDAVHLAFVGLGDDFARQHPELSDVRGSDQVYRLSLAYTQGSVDSIAQALTMLAGDRYGGVRDSGRAPAS